MRGTYPKTRYVSVNSATGRSAATSIAGPGRVVDEVDGQDILGCAADLDTVLDGEGRYTYVVSYPGDKPSATALAAASATWLPFSTEQPLARHLLILRNMLGDDFPQSVQDCTPGSDPASIAACAASMGPYYPQATACRAAVFEHGGPAACLCEE